MAEDIIKLKKTSLWDSVPTGIIAGDDGETLALEVGAGDWDGNSLDCTILPPSPWASDGNQFAGIIDGEILELFDNNNSDFISYLLNAPDWNEDFSIGFTAYLRVKATVNNNLLNGAVLFLRDGTREYQFKFLQDGTMAIIGSGTTNHDTAEFGYLELFISINSSQASIWVWNAVTELWVLLQSGLSPSAIGADQVIIGSRQSAGVGRSFWDYFNFKSAIESTPFRSDSPTPEMGVIAVGGLIVNWPVTSGLLGQKYDIGAGFVQPGTGSDAEMAAALIGLSPDTLNWKPPFASDGVTPAELDINGGAIACIGGETIVVSPLEVIEIEELEVIEL